MNSMQQPATVGQRQAMHLGTGLAADLPLEAEPAPGAHLVTQRRGYAHHGVYVGNGKVVHYAGFCGSAHRGPVEEVSLARFGAGHAIAVRPHPCPRYASDEVVRRACSRLGEDNYRLLTNNCEHLCTWCLFGESRSEQVETCLTHPRMALHALVCLFKAFVEAELKGGHFAARAA
jgi:hypothetical protein